MTETIPELVQATGRVSIECAWKNFETELPAAVAYLRQQLAEVAR